MIEIQSSDTVLDFKSGRLIGSHLERTTTTIGDLRSYFKDRTALNRMDPDQAVYWVEMEENKQKEGEEGGLFFGISHLCCGTVGDEFFMTKGHVHNKFDTAEYYWGIKGTGLLLLDNLKGSIRLIEVKPGAVLYIPGRTAHRLINIGNEELAVGAVWQTISGHNYGRGAQLFHNRVTKVGNSYQVTEA